MKVGIIGVGAVGTGLLLPRVPEAGHRELASPA
jgi:hypothetical protein